MVDDALKMTVYTYSVQAYLLCQVHTACVASGLADFIQPDDELSAWLEPGGSVVIVRDGDQDGGGSSQSNGVIL